MTEAPKSLLVRATKMVFYGGMRIRIGKTVTLADPSHFSDDSMEWVVPGTPDDTAAAIDASPKTRDAQGGVRSKRPGVPTGKPALTPDPGI